MTTVNNCLANNYFQEEIEMLCVTLGLGMMILLLTSSIWTMWKVNSVYNNVSIFIYSKL